MMEYCVIDVQNNNIMLIVEYVTIAQQIFVWDRMMSCALPGYSDILDILIHIMVKYQYLKHVVHILMVSFMPYDINGITCFYWKMFTTNRDPLTPLCGSKPVIVKFSILICRKNIYIQVGFGLSFLFQVVRYLLHIYYVKPISATKNILFTLSNLMFFSTGLVLSPSQLVKRVSGPLLMRKF